MPVKSEKFTVAVINKMIQLRKGGMQQAEIARKLNEEFGLKMHPTEVSTQLIRAGHRTYKSYARGNKSQPTVRVTKEAVDKLLGDDSSSRKLKLVEFLLNAPTDRKTIGKLIQAVWL